MSEKTESWASGELYNEFMGKWSIGIAGSFINWIRNSENDQAWVDIGCGTGALTNQIQKEVNPSIVIGVDPSEQFLHWANTKYANIQGIRFEKGEGDAIPFENESFDVVVSGLALNFMPNKISSLNEMIRVLKLGGTLAIYVWDYEEKMEFLRYFWNSVTACNPEAQKFDEGVIFADLNEQGLQRLMRKTNLTQIETKPLEINTYFENFDEFWKPFLGGQGPAGAYLKTISHSEIDDIKNHLLKSLPITNSGSISLIARAWAIKAKKLKDDMTTQ